MSPAKDGPRDWDKELAEIDKLIASGAGDAPVPAAGAPGAARPAAPPAAPGPPRAPGGGRRATAFTWLWFLLAVLLGAGLTQWPYERACGLPLYGYLASIGVFGLASLWSTVWSWRTRAAAVHFLSIALLFWGTFVGAREVLPRTGYARRSAAWNCPSPEPRPAGEPRQETSPAPEPAAPR